MNDRPTAPRTAITLLDKLRRTPMNRGSRMTEQASQLRDEIAAAIEAEDVPARLARRISLQLILKCDLAELRDRSVWSALGQVLEAEIRRLRTGLGLVDRQIIVALPKLSPTHDSRPTHQSARVWTHPVVANGRLYLRDQELLYCYDVAVKR